ncbi:MAG: FAD:protein transferase [Acidobacteriota bacterium]|nr:FAD:protein transferase [Acidobacteriota bacterium]
MLLVCAFCCNPVLVRKGQRGKTSAYDEFVTKTRRRLLGTAGALLLARALALAASGAVAASPAVTPGDDPPAPLRIAGSALGAQLEIEVRDLPRPAGEKALHAVWDAVVHAERELGALAAATAATGKAPLSEDLLDLLLRATSFCTWSDGASGPAGGAVYRLWTKSARIGALPTPDQLEEAAATAKCDRARLSTEARSIAISPGSELDLRGFVRGWAVDIAVRTLADLGATNFRVALGSVTRGMGAGPGGRGWPVPLPTLSASGNPESLVFLLNEALAVADPSSEALQVGREQIALAFDLRSGKPATSVSSVVTVTTLAADAEPLAMAMSVLGANGGQIRLGSLRPKPSVLWLLGSGETAVVSSSNWSAVRKP